VWSYGHLGRLVFHQKYKDARTGHVTFGRHALMIYLGFNSSTPRSSEWHCRIDVPYAVLEHTILSDENGTRSAMTLTLRSPPKIYEIVDTEDLHLYTGQSVVLDTGVVSAFSNLTLGASRSPKLERSRLPKLQRLCTLHPEHKENVGLCMV
jgi:hypothetical protein